MAHWQGLYYEYTAGSRQSKPIDLSTATRSAWILLDGVTSFSSSGMLGTRTHRAGTFSRSKSAPADMAQCGFLPYSVCFLQPPIVFLRCAPLCVGFAPPPEPQEEEDDGNDGNGHDCCFSSQQCRISCQAVQASGD